MSAETVRFHLVGVAPLLMHNARLCDPLDPWSREIAAITRKRIRTTADHERIAELEFLGSMWLNDGRPCIPATVIEGVIVAAARTRKHGRQARSGVICTDNATLVYQGPTVVEKLWEDPNFRLRIPVRTPGGRVMRTRPSFAEWQADVEISFLPTLVDADALETWLRIGGDQCGMGDFRPRFGRFTVESLPIQRNFGSDPVRRDLVSQASVGHGLPGSARDGRRARPSRQRRSA